MFRSYNLAPGSIGSEFEIKDCNLFWQTTSFSVSDYNSPSQPILEGYDGSQSDIILRLPKGVTCR